MSKNKAVLLPVFTCHCSATGGAVIVSVALSVQQHAGLLQLTGKLHRHIEPPQDSAVLRHRHQRLWKHTPLQL